MSGAAFGAAEDIGKDFDDLIGFDQRGRLIRIEILDCRDRKHEIRRDRIFLVVITQQLQCGQRCTRINYIQRVFIDRRVGTVLGQFDLSIVDPDNEIGRAFDQVGVAGFDDTPGKYLVTGYEPVAGGKS